MRIWSLHPQHLDAKGLVALWRETLLAQKVLLGETKGYRNHPQLARFNSHRDPPAAIAAYLHGILREAERRGYHFDGSKILRKDSKIKIRVTDGQIAYELAHLRKKLKVRDSAAYERLVHCGSPSAHPLFKVVSGEIEEWEIV
ncbi:MAG: pyrimidine dimer DNA glycosylase/endonuclease V [Sideroxyarcus sp.]|nr:pyrimidine dimer DNA glycosylase/endonuclease V [Sideroxyarcus sp.]